MAERTSQSSIGSKNAASRMQTLKSGLSKTNEHISNLLDILDKNISQSNALHQEFLIAQTQGLRIAATSETSQKKEARVVNSEKVVLLTQSQLKEFGIGSIARCFGPEYAILDQRKSPRIPNGDLLMIDRVLSITGEKGVIKPPASVVTEITIPDEAWYLRENEYPGVPLSILMEIALQPCGILSAYLGTSLVLPEESNKFRNLDGNITFTNNPVLIGKTITNRSQLLDTFSSGGMHIQKYSFELSVDHAVFLTGDSSFGYFSQKAMQQQKGLDGPETAINNADSIEKSTVESQSLVIPIETQNSNKRLINLVDSLRYTESAGKFANGVLSGSKHLGNDEWFYKCHFFQDPVMPGSLGFEAVMQGLWAYVKNRKLDESFTDPILDFSSNDPFIWKYRGQVIPENKSVNYRIHLKNSSETSEKLMISFDADFWVEGMRIYSFKNLSFTIKEGQE